MKPLGVAAPQLLITASAGTGKTTQLAWRYLRMLLHDSNGGVSPDRLLAVTFTRKAAGEIFDKILNELLQASADKGKCDALARHIGIHGLEPARVDAGLGRLLLALNRVRVGTLDSFFAELCKCFAPELGLPLGWAIVEEARAGDLKRVALGAGFEGVDTAQAAELLSAACGGRDERKIEAPLMRYLDTYEALAAEAAAEAWGAGLEDVGALLDDAALAAAREVLAAMPLPSTAKGEPDKRWRERVAKDLEAIGGGDWKELLKSKLALGAWGVAQSHQEAMFSGRPVLRECAQAYTPLVMHALAAVAGELAGRARRIRALVLPFAAQWATVQRRHAAYRFDDLPRRIAAAGAGLVPAELFFRLDGRIDHLLLDEFQDTSLLQWRALKALVAEVAAGGAAGRSFFCVGDPKQSIYGWRGGVYELCRDDTLKAEVPALGDLTGVSLAINFRSAPAVLGLVDRLYRGKGELPAKLSQSPAFMEAWRAFTADDVFPPPKSDKDDPAAPGYACVLAAPQLPDDEAESATYSADEEEGEDDAGVGDETGPGDPRLSSAARWIVAQARGPLVGREIGVLVRGNNALAQLVRDVKALLRAAGEIDTIEVSEEGGSPVRDGVAASVLISALRLADHPGDTAAAFHVLQSALGPSLRASVLRDVAADDWRAAALRLSRALRMRVADEGIAGALTYLADLAGWLDPGVLPPREAQRVEQLIAAAHGFDARAATLRPAAFVREAELLRRDRPGSARIRVMTIHQAKGLAFDVVVLPELWVPLVQRRRVGRPLVRRAGDTPFGQIQAVLPPPPAVLRPYLPVPLTNALHAAEMREYYEALCLLYVAVTRARYATYALTFAPRRYEGDATFAALLRARLAAAAGDGGAGRSDAADAGGGERGAGRATLPADEAGWTVLTACGDPAWTVRATGRTATDAATVPSLLPAPPQRFLRPATASTRLDHAVPSQLAHTRVHAADLLALDRDALDYGTAIHACFEQVAWLDDGAPDAAILAAALAAAGAAPERHAALVADFAAMLARPATAKALTRAGYAVRGGVWAAAARLDVYRERRFAMQHGGGVLSGAIDRLVIARDAAGNAVAAEVLDFKTDRIRDDAALTAATDRYRPQLAAYRVAAARSAGLDMARVGTTLLFVGVGRAVSVDG